MDLADAPRFLRGVAAIKVAKGDASGLFKVVHGLGSDNYHVTLTPSKGDVKLLCSVAAQALDDFTVVVQPLNPVFNIDSDIDVQYLVVAL